MKGAIRLLSSWDTLAPATQATLTSLRALHPPTPLDRRATPTTSTAPLQATPQTVLGGPSHPFPQGSGPHQAGWFAAPTPEGPAGWGAGELWNGESGEGGTGGDGQGRATHSLLEAITDLINLLLSGGVPQFPRATLVRRLNHGD